VHIPPTTVLFFSPSCSSVGSVGQSARVPESFPLCFSIVYGVNECPLGLKGIVSFASTAGCAD